jgi:hypothetical protein
MMPTSRYGVRRLRTGCCPLTWSSGCFRIRAMGEGAAANPRLGAEALHGLLDAAGIPR